MFLMRWSQKWFLENKKHHFDAFRYEKIWKSNRNHTSKQGNDTDF